MQRAVTATSNMTGEKFQKNSSNNQTTARATTQQCRVKSNSVAAATAIVANAASHYSDGKTNP